MELTCLTVRKENGLWVHPRYKGSEMICNVFIQELYPPKNATKIKFWLNTEEVYEGVKISLYNLRRKDFTSWSCRFGKCFYASMTIGLTCFLENRFIKLYPYMSPVDGDRNHMRGDFFLSFKVIKTTQYE